MEGLPELGARGMGGEGDSSGAARMSTPTTETAAHRPVSREMTKILADCRDLAIHRMLLAFTALIDKVSDMLMARAARTAVRDEQQTYYGDGAVLQLQRPSPIE